MDDLGKSGSSHAWASALVTATIIIACFIAGCGGGGHVIESGPPSPCALLCAKYNECLAPGAAALPCGYVCTYGGNIAAGLAPTPVCPDLAAQTSCVQAAVTSSCADYAAAARACPTCAVLAGSPCAADSDCQRYLPNYYCDRSRPGGYCTAACRVAGDCHAVDGPEECVPSRAPSFAPQVPATQGWCLLGCSAETTCGRSAEGYRCSISAARRARVPAIHRDRLPCERAMVGACWGWSRRVSRGLHATI